MVSQLASVAQRARRRCRVIRQHGGVPGLILDDHPPVHIRQPVLQVGPFERIGGHVEQEGVVIDFKPFQITVAEGTLSVVLVSPEQLAGDRSGVVGERGQQVDPVGGIGGVRLDIGRSREGLGANPC